MTISNKKINEKINERITVDNDELSFLQLSAAVNSLNSATVFSVNDITDLPLASENKGRLIYVKNISNYKYSNGEEWISDYDSDITNQNLIYSFGINNLTTTAGMLGDNSSTNRSSPVSVAGGFTDWCSIHASSPGYSSTAVRTNGTLWLWGSAFKIKDNISAVQSPINIIYSYDNDWTCFSLSRHVVALKTDRTLWTWGCGSSGQLGDGYTTNRSSPVSVVGGFTDWCAVSAGSVHTAAIRTNGVCSTLWTWGFSGSGQLGDGYLINRSSPVSVVGGFTDWCAVSAGTSHTAAIRTNGVCSTLWTWGCGSSGQLGANDNITHSSPVSVVGGFTDWCAVSAGNCITAAIRTNGVCSTLWTWGHNNYGQLGNNCSNNVLSPVSVVGGFTDWCAVSSSFNHMAAIRTNGTLWTWGQGSSGRLGDGYLINRSSPVSVVGGFTDWCAVSAGTFQTSAVRTNGSIWSWGQNNVGQLGDGTGNGRSSPVSVLTDITNWKQIETKSDTLGFLTTNNCLYFIGCNFGRFGNSTISNSFDTTFHTPSGNRNKIWKNSKVGDNQLFAIDENNSLWSWGASTCGILGNGNRSNDINDKPVKVLGNFNDVIDVSVNSHAITLRSNGSLWAWGRGTEGQLGDNTRIDRSSPVSVIGTFDNSDWICVCAGLHSVAIKSNGTMWTWGFGSQGQLGNNCSNDQSSPVSVVGGFTDWCAVSAGGNHTAAIRTNGSLWTWGCGLQGQVGDGYAVDRSSPVSVVGGFTDWCAVGAGSDHTAAIKTDGSLWTWGFGGSGQLGNNTTIGVSSPVSVVGGFSDWCAVSAGRFRTAAIRTDGSLWTWGNGLNAELGDGYTTNRSSPVSVVGGFTDWCKVYIGSLHMLALRSNGTLWTWGNAFQGVLGINSAGNRSSPVSVVGGFTDWCAISVGDNHNAAIRSNGTLWVWGNNSNGQLGIEDFVVRSSPTLVSGNFNWCVVGAGYGHTAAIRNNGSLWTWGDNSNGQLSQNLKGLSSSITKPIEFKSPFGDFIKISFSNNTIAGIRSNGSLWTWGVGGQGRLGDGYAVDRSSPVSVLGGFTDWCAVSAGRYHTAAIRTNGTLWTWGDGNSGLLGDGTIISRSSPVSVVGGFTDWCVVSAANSHTAAVRTNGTLWTWGNGVFGRLGDGYAVNSSSPVSVVGGFTDWCAVSAGRYHTAAIRTNGTLWTWGGGVFGRLGDGYATSRSSPVSVVGGFSDWCAVSAGRYHTAAIRTDGSLWTWGCGGSGQLGNNCTSNFSSPVSVVGGFTDWCAVGAGRYYTAAIRTNGTLWTWGSGGQGRLGNNCTSNFSSPVSIVSEFSDWCAIITIGDSIGNIAIRQNKEVYVWGLTCYNQFLSTELYNINSPVNIVGDLVDWCAVSAGTSFTAAIRTNGSLWTWGCNSLGKLAIYPTIQNRSSPVSVNTIYQDWCAVSRGTAHIAALRTNGTLWIWGTGTSGQLGNNDKLNFYFPQCVVGSFTDWCAVNAGRYHNAAIRTDGSLWTWGCGGQGRLGDNCTSDRSSPVSVVGGFTDWCAVSAGNSHTAAIRTNGELWIWGFGSGGKLGNNCNSNFSSPVSVVGGFTDWCAVSAGGYHTTAMRTNGELWTWGAGTYGQLGDGYATSRSSPVSVVGGFTDWCAVSAGTFMTAAIRTNGSLWTWGAGSNGRLGNGYVTNRSSPVSVLGGFTDWCAVSAEKYYTAALRTDGTLWTWGDGNNGRLGNNCNSNFSSPVSVVGGFSDWCAVSAGGQINSAIRTDGTLWSWGFGNQGQLGDVDPIVTSPVVIVGGFCDWCAVSAGVDHIAAVQTNGTLWTWGNGINGRLGDGTIISRSSPVSVVGGFTDWCAVSAGSYHTAAVKTDGSLWTWGNGGNGRLGNNFAVDQLSPVSVVGGFSDWCAVSAGQSHTAALRIKYSKGF